MIAVCSACGELYEAGSEEQAYEVDRQCRTCWAKGVANAHRAMHGMRSLDDRCSVCGRWPEACRCDVSRTVAPEEGY